MNKMKRRLSFICVILCLFMACTPAVSVEAEEPGEGRVLFISSYSYAWDTVQTQIEGIKAGLGNDVTLDYEFMDTKRVDDETSRQQFYEGLSYRLSRVEPYDAVILGDDAALLFATEYQDELFQDIPLIYEGVNDEEVALALSEDPLITGVLEKLSIDENIEFALKFYPKAKKVVAILDDSITGEAERKRFYNSAEAYPGLTFTEINASELTTMELKNAIRSLDEDSILFFVVMTEDASDKQYTIREAAQMLSRYSKVPIFRMIEGGIGEGFLGGNIVSMYRSGEIAAGYALEILHGRWSGELGVIEESPNVYRVDMLVMQKYGLDMDALPEGTEIVNYQSSFYERNKEAIVPGILLILFLIAVIMVSGVDNIKRRRLMKELEEARGVMESASQHDFLTGIPNRSKFMEDLEQTIAEKKPCTVVMIDIDDFKHINDTYGHTAGDDALRELARRLKRLQSQILTPYRFAGDEFILLIRGAHSNLVEKTAYECRQLFGKPYDIAGVEMKVCGSIGIASYPQDAKDAEELINNADDAMYLVKKSGKNNFAFYNGKKG